MARFGVDDSDSMMDELCEDLKTTEANMQSASLWKTTGESLAAGASAGHAYQRSNKVALDGFAAPTYQTKAASTMMDSAKRFFSKS